MRAVIAALSWVSLALIGGAAAAHQQKEAQSDISLNTRTGLVEIVHRFSVHDAEHVMTDDQGRPVDLLADPAAQGRFAAYLARTFSIIDGVTGAPVTLTLLGAEIEGAYLYIYQETDIPPAPIDWMIRHDALREIWPDQVNRVNIRAYGDLKTLIFADQAEVLTVSFDAGDSAAAAP